MYIIARAPVDDVAVAVVAVDAVTAGAVEIAFWYTNSIAGTSVVQVNATDLDTGINAKIR